MEVSDEKERRRIGEMEGKGIAREAQTVMRRGRMIVVMSWNGS